MHKYIKKRTEPRKYNINQGKGNSLILGPAKQIGIKIVCFKNLILLTDVTQN